MNLKQILRTYNLNIKIKLYKLPKQQFIKTNFALRDMASSSYMHFPKQLRNLLQLKL